MRQLLLSLLALLTLTGTANAAERRKVIIDQDALGGPGLQPILLLLQDPNVEVLGITIVSGDGWQPEETAATLRMLELVGRTDVPVFAGATFPLVNSKARNARREAMYGALAYRGAWTDQWPADDTMNRRAAHAPDVIPPLAVGMPTIKAAPGSAADFMLEMSRKYPGQVSIIAMGPLTNLALAQRLDDGFAARIKEVVTEGGSFLGNDLSAKQGVFANQVAYAPRMSFNFVWDPEAAHIVFTSPWPRLTMVTGDASDPAVGTQALFDRATASGSAAARYVKRTAEAGFPLWDEVAAIAWLDPATVTKQGPLSIDIDLMQGPNYGALVTWPAGKGPGLGEQSVNVVYAMDVARVDDIFVSHIGK